MWLEVGADSANLRRLCEEVAPLLDNNPRRIKQFLNVLRLNAVLAHERGLFRRTGGRKALTLEQLSRFIALVLRYPALVTDLREDPALLENLENFAIGAGGIPTSVSAVTRSYLDNRKLMRFLEESSGGRLSEADLQSLLSTVPELKDRWTSRPAATAPSAFDAGARTTSEAARGVQTSTMTSSRGGGAETELPRDDDVVPEDPEANWGADRRDAADDQSDHKYGSYADEIAAEHDRPTRPPAA